MAHIMNADIIDTTEIGGKNLIPFSFFKNIIIEYIKFEIFRGFLFKALDLRAEYRQQFHSLRKIQFYSD